MPVYEYRCSSCGKTLEAIQPMGSGPPGPCPACHGELKRVYGRVGVRFAGWGFERTDRLASKGRPKKDFKALREKAEEIAEG